MKFKEWLFLATYYRKINYKFLLSFLLISLNCFHNTHIREYEDIPLNIQTLSLTNHREYNKFRGDWTLRRQRLDLINENLNKKKPDILFLQEALQRNDSDYDNDIEILKFGSLHLYFYEHFNYTTHQDTQEIESIIIFLKNLRQFYFKKDKSKLWKIEGNSYLMKSHIEMNSNEIVLFNIYIASPQKITNNIYEIIENHIKDDIKKHSYCLERIIISGNIGTNIENKSYQNFLLNLSLKDTAEDFCTFQNKCYTKTPENSFGKILSNSVNYIRNDRILVHKATIVKSANTVHTNSKKTNSVFAEKYKLSNLFPSKRFGWEASVIIPKCDNSNHYPK